MSLLCFTLGLGFSLAIQVIEVNQPLSHEEHFLSFQQQHKKQYSSLAEEQYRFQIFRENFARVEEHNKMTGSSYSRGVNRWSDLTQEEWEEAYLRGYKRMGVERNGSTSQGQVGDLPDRVDWRELGAVTPVKNQGRCGSCWAHSMTQQIESYTAITTGTLVELSTQQVTSCAPNTVNCGGTGGCQGSTPPLGYNYVQLFGQVSETDYPYISGTTTQTESCQYSLDSIKPVASITGYNNLPPNDQAAIMEHIAKVGPLSISVAANTFKDYHGGVFTGCDYNEDIQLNHAVQLVGYGTDYSPAGVKDYWLVRNSWGEDWGEGGYIRILRESSPQCGIDSSTSQHVCQDGPGFSQPITVCGMCGLLYETSFPLGAHLL